MTELPPNPADVAIVADALSNASRCVHRDDWSREAHAVVTALAGRLLPADAETRTEHGVRLTWKDGYTEDFKRGTRAEAEAMHNGHVEQHRHHPNWAVTSALISRETGSWAGPWLPEESGA